MHDEILNANGDKLRLFAVWCARRVQHLITDERSLNALDTAERYAKGNATREELEAACEEAKNVNLKDWWRHCADDAARFSAFNDSLHAAYFAAESAEWAVANEYADRVTQPDKWEARREEEWNIHTEAINESIGRELRMFAVKCTRRVQHLIRRGESLHALDTAERFVNGEASREELVKAYSEACVVTEQWSHKWKFYEADSSAILTACKSSLNAALLGSGCAARARAIEVDGIQHKDASPRWMAAYEKEEAEQKAMLKRLLDGN